MKITDKGLSDSKLIQILKKTRDMCTGRVEGLENVSKRRQMWAKGEVHGYSPEERTLVTHIRKSRRHVQGDTLTATVFFFLLVQTVVREHEDTAADN